MLKSAIMAEKTKDEENRKSDVAFREERVLKFWQENKIFEKSLKQTEGKKEFIFYDGPVTANSAPVLHTMVPFAFKDIIPRYKTMRGYHVRRKGGWDTHGLPVELQIEKKLGFKSKNDIENYGIAAFNKLCQDSIWEYIELWKNFTERMGYWADQENPYVTYHNDYIESLWNVVKKIDEQKLLYKDYKVVPWCPRCGTALSSHELAQGYEDVKDLSVYMKFRIVGSAAEKFSQVLGSPGPSPGQTIRKSSDSSAFILAWTTTPWTLPGNVALAVGEDVNYVKVQVGNEIFILAEERISILSEGYKIVERLKGKKLVGLEYEPLFPYLKEQLEKKGEPSDKIFKVYAADFVNTEEGTGIVHTAVMYGQDDFELGTKVGLPKHHLVGLDGKFLSGTGFLESRFVRDEQVAVDIIKDLAHRNLLFKKEKYEHSYPHCWRCRTALIYYARDSWYIKMSDPKIKKKLISENKKINWEPAHIRDGRFGEWLREIKDWAISRERYWGTPLPVWVCEKCDKKHVVSSLEDLKSKTKKSGNKYFVMRHGEAENNIESVTHNKDLEHDAKLTEKGKEQTLKSFKNFKEKIDIIISSTLERAKETTKIACKHISFPLEKVIYDERVKEWETGTSFEGKDKAIFKKYYDKDYLDNPNEILPGGESFVQVIKRIGQFIYELESEYVNKNIFIFGHGGATDALSFITKGLSLSSLSSKNDLFSKLENAEIREFDFVPFPHNENYELDYHRPYIDEVSLICDCSGNLMRTKEVMDVWFDSGAMPFAQDHYPFSAKGGSASGGDNKTQKLLYPADFISEGIDQTRGWFYTLHAVGVLMGKGLAYKNVICLGHLLDAQGKKMSKSLGNVVDPWVMMDKYGVDTLRLWMYSVNQPGESKNFDEKTVALLSSQVFGLLYNVLAFYELYRDKAVEKNDRPKSKNILDVWILARLTELIGNSTKQIDDYKLLEPVRAIRDFIGDLSTWYLRRSRERIKEGDKEAKMTLYFILKTLAKVMAPFAPFTAEDLWLKLRNKKDGESVHLAKWPKGQVLDSSGKVLENMQQVRNIVSLGLEARQKAKIQVRQPLASLKLKVESKKLSSKYLDLIKDELNVKEIIFDNFISNELELDTNITSELKAEGEYREFMRELQDKRKKMGLSPRDKMALPIETIYKKYKILPSLQEHMLRTAAVASMICDSIEIPVDKESVVIACLLHDMGNIIKFRMHLLPEFLEPEGLEYWQKVQNEYIEKYGKNEHKATIKIMKEINLPDNIIFIADQIDFPLLCNISNGNDINAKIAFYADARVDPHGVVSYDERMNEGKKRYKNHKSTFGAVEEERKKLVECGRKVEKQIFSKCKIKPEDISNESIEPIISGLRNFVIK